MFLSSAVNSILALNIILVLVRIIFARKKNNVFGHALIDCKRRISTKLGRPLAVVILKEVTSVTRHRATDFFFPHPYRKPFPTWKRRNAL